MNPIPDSLLPKWMLTAAWMLSLIAGGALIWWLATIPRVALHPALIITFALSGAFTWVEVLKWGVVKPFTCVKCMSGWFAVILAWWSGADYWLLYALVGLFVGAMYSAIKMRWL